MNFNYEKIKQRKESGGSHWASYSDLFMILAFLFLLLYVVSSFRSGTVAISTQIEVKAAKDREIALQQQLRTYDSLREDYLDTEASAQEREMYEDLVDKISLLQDSAEQEKNKLYVKYKENKDKEAALNNYQMLIKNIINANMLAKNEIRKRDNVIALKAKNINTLEKDVKTKSAKIRKDERKLAKYQHDLTKKKKEIKWAISSKRKMKAQLHAELKDVKKQSKQKLGHLEKKYKHSMKTIFRAKKIITKNRKHKKILLAKLQRSEKRYVQDIDQLKQNHGEELEKEKQAYQKDIKVMKKSSKAQLAAERRYQAKIEKKNQAYNEKMEHLNNQLVDAKGGLTKTKTLLASLDKKLKDAESNAENLKGEVDKARAVANKRKLLASRIMKNFKKNNIDAYVDANSGDVVMNFGREYFDYGKSNLKPEMKSRISRTIPVYAHSLFSDKKISSSIKDIEIIGFASPTYNGMMVNPRSLSGKNRRAIDFNLDLSYRRAKSIFQYMFDTENLKFDQQQLMLAFVKVTGRSYLTEEVVSTKDKGKISKEKFCKIYNCKKAQKVIMRVNLNDQ